MLFLQDPVLSVHSQALLPSCGRGEQLHTEVTTQYFSRWVVYFGALCVSAETYSKVIICIMEIRRKVECETTSIYMLKCECAMYQFLLAIGHLPARKQL